MFRTPSPSLCNHTSNLCLHRASFRNIQSKVPQNVSYDPLVGCSLMCGGVMSWAVLPASDSICLKIGSILEGGRCQLSYAAGRMTCQAPPEASSGPQTHSMGLRMVCRSIQKHFCLSKSFRFWWFYFGIFNCFSVLFLMSCILRSAHGNLVAFHIVCDQAGVCMEEILRAKFSCLSCKTRCITSCVSAKPSQNSICISVFQESFAFASSSASPLM